MRYMCTIGIMVRALTSVVRSDYCITLICEHEWGSVLIHKITSIAWCTFGGAPACPMVPANHRYAGLVLEASSHPWHEHIRRGWNGSAIHVLSLEHDTRKRDICTKRAQTSIRIGLEFEQRSGRRSRLISRDVSIEGIRVSW